MRRAFAAFLILVVFGAALGYSSWNYVRGAALVARAAGAQGWGARAAAIPTGPFVERDLTVPSRYGELRSRLYRPDGRIDRTLVLVPGVHARGIDEPRLIGFARDLARLGVAVLTPELSDLKRYAITTRATDMIEDAALWTLTQPDLVPDGRVGLMGISFGGGLSIVAAGRPAVRDRVAFAFSFGGHADLPRVLRYLCTGVLPDGTRYPPHDYGVVIILLGVADMVVPPEQVASLQDAILAFLNASHLDMVDKRRAQEEFERAKRLQTALPEPAAGLMRAVNARDVATLGPKLLPYVEKLGQEPALSPERSAPPSAPVYLLHGTDDNVIPAIESALLAKRLDSVTEVHYLSTPLVTHAELDRPAQVMDAWRLVAFWAGLLSE